MLDALKDIIKKVKIKNFTDSQIYVFQEFIECFF